MSKNSEIVESVNNLYIICLQYYEKLKELKHPKINLITEIMDALIELKLKKVSGHELKIKFDIIHGLAFNNINTIYEYDLENQKEEEETKNVVEQEEKKILVKPKKIVRESEIDFII